MFILKKVGSVCSDLLGSICSGQLGSLSSGQVGSVSLNFTKTNTLTRFLLPDFALDCLNFNNTNLLLPRISVGRFNASIKKIMELAGWTEIVGKTRQKMGIKKEIWVSNIPRKQYRFCDLVSSHTMRRTAITTMLCLGMSENLVRSISGHSSTSKEFYKYVKYSQAYKDEETMMIFEKLKLKTL